MAHRLTQRERPALTSEPNPGEGPSARGVGLKAFGLDWEGALEGGIPQAGGLPGSTQGEGQSTTGNPGRPAHLSESHSPSTRRLPVLRHRPDDPRAMHKHSMGRGPGTLDASYLRSDFSEKAPPPTVRPRS
jgi:hypothetical protein